MEFIKRNTTYLLNDSSLPKLSQLVVEEILTTPNISMSSKLYFTNQLKKFYNLLLRGNGIIKREIDIWYNKMKDLIRQLNEDNLNKKIKHKSIYKRIETKTITIQIQPPYDGIINDLSKNGYCDITFIIKGKKQKISKNLLLIQNNEYLSLLINESKNNEIELPNEINEYEFKLMMQYYGYAKIDLNSENVIILMKVSYILKDMIVYNNMKKYNIYF